MDLSHVAQTHLITTAQSSFLRQSHIANRHQGRRSTFSDTQRAWHTFPTSVEQRRTLGLSHWVRPVCTYVQGWMSQVCGAGRSAEHAVPESVSPYFWTNIMHISSVGIPYAQYGPGVTLRSKDGIRTGRWVGNGTVDDLTRCVRWCTVRDGDRLISPHITACTCHTGGARGHTLEVEPGPRRGRGRRRRRGKRLVVSKYT